MASTSLTGQSLESHIVTLLEKLDHVRGDVTPPPCRLPMQVEIRTLEFWRAIIAECLATFFYVFLVCGAFVPWTGQTPGYVGVAFTAGFGAATLVQSFGYISGGHMNPAVTLAMTATRKISPLRSVLYVTAQCGGGIAGAALLYGVTIPGLQGTLGVTTVTKPMTPWQGFAVEFILTFILVFIVFSVNEPSRKPLGASAMTVGVAYLTCSIVGLPCTGASMNPARSLGPAFVMDVWDQHWVYWFAPLTASVLAGLIHEFIFNPNRSSRPKDSIDGDSISVNSEEESPYDKSPNYNTIRAQHYDQYRPPTSNPVSPNSNYAQSLYNAPAYRSAATESIYGGTKSLYTRSPPVVRACLNRSQSVYTKPNRSEPRGPAAGQSLYPAHNIYTSRPCGLASSSYRSSRPDVTTSKHTDNLPYDTNKAEGLFNPNDVYGSRPVTRPDPVYTRPEPVYGFTQPGGPSGRRQDSADSAYGTYCGNSSYSSSRCSASRMRPDLTSPTSCHSGTSGPNTPNSVVSYHSQT